MAMSTRSDQQQHAYQIIAEIGKGAYGTVYRAKDIKNQGKFVALKEIRISTRSEEGMPMSTIREIAMLQQLEKFEHPNIVRLLDVWSGRLDHNVMKLMLVFEHMDRDLAEYLEKSPSCGLSPDNIKDIMHQILNGVDFLHTNRIVHRDLKPQNILISSQGCVKIADFGLARIYSFHMALTTVVVTLYYRSPEVLLQDSYCSAIDIWSCGTILAELYLRKPLFQGTSEIDQLCKIFHIMGLPPAKEWPANCSFLRSSFKDEPKKPLKDLIPNIDDQAAELLEKMLVFDQRRRITCAEILRDPWFTDDADISTSSLSSSSMSLNTSASSSADNMDSGNMISTKKYTDSQQTSDHDPDRPACPRFIRVPYRMINGNTPDTQQDRVNDFNCARADRVPSSDVFGTGTYQMNDTHLQSVQDAIAASFNRSSAVSDMNTSTHDGSTLTGHYNQHCRDGPEANAGLSSAPVQFTNCQPNANKVQDAYRPSPINGNQFKEFYEPVTCNNGDGSNGKGSEQISAVCSHYPQPSHNSSVTGDTSCISSTSVSRGYQPPSNGVLAGSLSASMHHISESFRSVMTTTSGFQKPGMAGLNEHHQLPVTTGNHHQGPFQPPTTTATEPMANASMPESHHFSAHRSTEDTGFQGPATDRYQVDNGTSTREHVGLKIAPYQGTDHNNQNKEPALNNNPHTSHIHLADTEGPSPKKRVKRSSSY